MDNISKRDKIILSVFAVVSSVLAGVLGMVLMAALPLTFAQKMVCGTVFYMAPLSVILLVIYFHKKSS